MMIDFIWYALAGVAAGFIAGLFGVGGGMIIVPVLVFLFSRQGFSPEIHTHMAIATSLAVIVLTAISSVKAHHRRGAVRLDLLKQMGISLFIGAFIGAFIAKQLPHTWLKLIIAVFAAWAGYGLFFKRTATSTIAQERIPYGYPLYSAGGVIGLLSAIFGIGGGTFTVPYLVRHGVAMQQAVGTAAAAGLPIACAGVLSFIIFGQHLPQLPKYAVGYVYLPALLGISATSIFAAKWGAQLAHRMNGAQLKQWFGLLLFVVAIYFFVLSKCWVYFMTL